MTALERKTNAPFMMPISGKYRDLGTMVEGKVEAGVIKKGMSLIMMPNKEKIDVAALYGEQEDEVAIAQCGDQVRIRLRGIEEEDVLPGFVLCSPKRLVHNVKSFEAQIKILELKSILSAGRSTCSPHLNSTLVHLVLLREFFPSLRRAISTAIIVLRGNTKEMTDSLFITGFNCVLHVHSAVEEVTFAALLHKLQPKTGRKSKMPPTHAKKGDSIIARMEVTGGAGTVCVEKFEDYAQMGRFTLRDQVGAVTK